MNLINEEPGRRCESCQKEMSIPASAVHKRFCNTQCRNQWHKQQRSQGLQLLKQAQAQQAIAKGKE